MKNLKNGDNQDQTVDLSNYIVAVAGGGSGGITFQDNTTSLSEISKIADGSFKFIF